MSRDDDRTEDFAKIANEYKAFYDALIHAKFSREEALELLIAWIGRDKVEDEQQRGF